MTQNLGNDSRHLQDAFQEFSKVSEQLSESYRLLEQRAAVLAEELAAARSERLEQLAEKERLANRLQRLLEALPGAVVVLDGEDVIQECNPAALELLGYPLLGQTWTVVASRALPGLHDEDGYHATLRDGREISISTRILGSEPGRILLLKDESETRRLQEMLDRHKRLSAMGEMVARLAHQIRTPLASTMLYLSHLRKPDGQGEHQIRYAEKASAGLRQLERMVDDMLVYARGGEFTPEQVSVALLLEDLRATLEPQLQQCDGELQIINHKTEAIIEGNHDMLLGAMLNLATNALQMCGQGVRLMLEVLSVAGNNVEIRITDNGPGIVKEIIDRIFEPFFTTRSGGTGLGLAVVRAVVQGHRGDICVYSEAGQGATFVLRFPVTLGEQLLASSAWSRVGGRHQRVTSPGNLGISQSVA